MDSGEGGVYTLSKIKAVLPNENFIMFKDKKNSPYGNKNKQILLKIATENITYLTKKYHVKLIVLACNTMSAVIFNDLVNIFKNHIILPIVPNIKDAIETCKNTLVLGTYSTIKHSAVCKFYRDKKMPTLFFYGFKTLAKLIDENVGNLDKIKPNINKKLQQFKKHKIQNIVLGCTHYNLIKNQLCEIFDNENIIFFENSEALAQNVKSVLTTFDLLNENTSDGTEIVLTT
jgi:glutamate racemase